MDVIVSAERDGDSVTDFRADAPNIYIRWDGTNLPLHGGVRVAWVAEDVGGIADPNFIVDQSETEVRNATFGGLVTLSRPKDGWAAGKYRVEVYLDEQPLKSIPVTISE